MADAQSAASVFQQHPGPHSVVVVFDISGSMGSRDPETGMSRWQEARRATAYLLYNDLQPGDDLVILPFDSLVRKPIILKGLTEQQLQSVGQNIPDAMSGESGTNMRLAHDDALPMVESHAGQSGHRQPWRAIIVVSDGFNDAPPRTAASAWNSYIQFCDVHSGDQDRYPNTPTCVAWRKAALKFQQSGRGETLGLGVKIVDGVPEYRPMNEKPASYDNSSTQGTIGGTVLDGNSPAAGVTVTALNSDGAEVQTARSAEDGSYTLSSLSSGDYSISAQGAGGSARASGIPPGTTGVILQMHHSLLWLWVILAVLVVVAALVAAATARGRRQAMVRVQIKDSQGRNRTYWIGGHARITIGGQDSPVAFPLAPFDTPAASLRHTGANYVLAVENGFEAEVAGRSITDSGPVAEHTIIMIKDKGGKKGSFEFWDISSRTRATAQAIAGQSSPAGTSSVLNKLDSDLKS
jgi:hypothetical protein